MEQSAFAVGFDEPSPVPVGKRQVEAAAPLALGLGREVVEHREWQFVAGLLEPEQVLVGASERGFLGILS